MISVLDIETTFTKEGDNTPYNSENKLVSVGVNNEYLFFNHSEYDGDSNVSYNRLQSILNETTLLIGHNLKFDLSWLLECGFKYSGKVWDTMIAEYVLLRGVKKSLKLSEVCERREVGNKFSTLKSAVDSGLGIANIPIKDLEKYGRNDVAITKSLYEKQVEAYQGKLTSKMIPHLDMLNEFLVVLTNMERNGIQIDVDYLSDLQTILNKEYMSLKVKISNTIQEVMGDTPINITSSEQLCKVIYSREIIDKKDWATTFGLGLDENGRRRKPMHFPSNTFSNIIDAQTKPVYFTIGSKCKRCHGVGIIKRVKKDGTLFARSSKCPDCKSQGVVLTETSKIAGFNVKPKSSYNVTANGFSLDTTNLEYIADRQHGKLKVFVSDIIRYKQLEKYLSTFVDKMRNVVFEDIRLHPSFNQTVTVTGRLSCSDPNFQNIPRGDKLPIKKVVVSRFENGEIIDMDFSQLEFRVAAFLSQDEQAMSDILNGVDIHQITADALGIDRQSAKAFTFLPLYGGSRGDEGGKKWNETFKKRYKRIIEWQIGVEDLTLQTKILATPSGKQWFFPDIVRKWGGSNKYTQTRNYPVQSFATADIVPVACINLHNQIAGMKSKIINTVHDSIIIDAYPTEVNDVIAKLKYSCDNIKQSLFERYKINFNIPLEYEIKKGYNWLDTKTI